MRNVFLATALCALPVAAGAQSMPDWQSYQATGNPGAMVRSAGTADSVAA
ncbi:hypothetical protein [Komagataeibacter saccharivorans]|nr:hypothetical protein [Komagataeibacter saccharivorans]